VLGPVTAKTLAGAADAQEMVFLDRGAESIRLALASV